MALRYQLSTERVNEALETVKHDLMKVQEEDDQIMKKLLNLNATIQKLTGKSGQRCCKSVCGCGKSNCGGKRIISASAMRKIDTPVPLTSTVAAFRRFSIGSNGSDLGHSDDEINAFSDSDCEENISSKLVFDFV